MQLPTQPRRTWAEIDLGALRHNARVARELAGSRAALLAVVKANAYGHGAVECARALREEVRMLGVANLAEAAQLRAAGLDTDILILGPALPSEREEIVLAGFMPVVSSAAEAEAFAAFGKTRIHLSVDTGMGRMGIWQDDFASELEKIRAIAGCEVAGVATHLPVPDEDADFTEAQLQRFEALVRPRNIPLIHALNSAGVIGFATHSADMVRAGLMLYGSSPIAAFQPRLRPVMTWKTRIVLVREVGAGRGVSYGRTFLAPHTMRVATLAVGYADGYLRALAGHNAAVLIRGRRCPLLGRVTMDMLMVDVTALDGAAEGEEAVLLGQQDGAEISAAELAERAGTIPWEIFTGVKTRVERIYRD